MIATISSEALVGSLLRRFGGANEAMLHRVLTPYRLPIVRIDRTPPPSGAHTTALFEAEIPADVWTDFEPGASGKVVPRSFVEGRSAWKELVKARIHRCENGRAYGELHLPGVGRFSPQLALVQEGDLLEIDAFGVTSKIESALTEAALFSLAQSRGWKVTRMPENVAMHLGTQNYYDFRLERNGQTVRVELKSLWGTDTTQCRLIHTKSREDGTSGKNNAREDRQVWRTSSCRYEDQDIFAVAMWLRTGRIDDFAFALSVPTSIDRTWGLPATRSFPEHVVQNIPISDPPAGAWTSSLDEAVERLHVLRQRVPALARKISSLKDQDGTKKARPASAARLARPRR